MTRLHHKGTLTAEAGVLFWAAAMGLAALRGYGYPIAEIWVVVGLIVGLLLIVLGVIWESRVDRMPVSNTALTTLHWFARYCPHAAELLRNRPHPTWAEAFHVEDQCRKHATSRRTKGDVL